MYNCCEFCDSKHTFSVNGGVYEFEHSYPEASQTTHCMSLEMIGEGTILINMVHGDMEELAGVRP